MALGALASRLRLPSLVGMLLAGILLGPCVLNLLSPSLLGISADLRQLALVIILTRAGLSLELEDLRRAGRPAVLLCFVPASFEVLGMVLLAPRLLGVDVLDAAIMGAVVGAVSPAVIVPRMLRLMEEGYGADKGIPQMILAGASVDDVFVIVLFTSFTGMAQGGSFSPAALAGVPVSIVLGGAAGLGLGYVLAKCFTRFHLRDSAKVVVLLALAFLLVALEDAAEGVVPFSGLLAVLGTGLGLRRWRRPAAERLTAKFGKLWVAAEVMLFVLVGAEVDIGYAAAAGLAAVATVLGVDVLDAAIMGAVVGAVSPAVIVPRMLRLMEEGYGADKGIPQMILAGASVDDVFVIVLFTSFTGMAQGGSFSPAALAGVPVSIVLGGAAGLGLGYVLAKCFTRFHLRDSAKVVVLLALAFLLVALEDAAEGVVPFSGLLAVLGTGLGLRRWRRPAAERLTAKFGKLWVAAEVMLFVLVGAEVDIGYAAAAGLAAVATVLGVLCFRAVGVLLCVAGSRLSGRERLFAVLAYLPKATVQAAIGGVPLAMGLACGQVVLTVAVVAILVTAPSVYTGCAQHSLAPAGIASSTITRWSFSSPCSVWTAESSMPQLSCPIILRGGRLIMATRVLPTSSSGL